MNRMVLTLVLSEVIAAVAMKVSQFDSGEFLQRASPRDPVDVSIFCGGEKAGLVANPKVASILPDRDRITLDAMVRSRFGAAALIA